MAPFKMFWGPEKHVSGDQVDTGSWPNSPIHNDRGASGRHYSLGYSMQMEDLVVFTMLMLSVLGLFSGRN